MSKCSGFNEIDIYDNFFELGADSVLLMKIQAEIDNKFPGKATVVEMFEHSTISKLAQFIVDKDIDGEKKVITPRDHVPSNENIDIAIIGMSINMPGAKNIETFWENIHSKIDSWGKFSKNRRYDVENLLNFMGIPLNSIEYDTGVFLDEIDKFDYNFFKISPREAGYTDPHHRLFLQTACRPLKMLVMGKRN